MPLPHLSTSLSHEAPPLKTDTEGVPSTPAQGAIISPKAVPWLTGLAALAYVVAKSLPPHTVAANVAENILDLAVLFGLASPGLRRR